MIKNYMPTGSLPVTILRLQLHAMLERDPSLSGILGLRSHMECLLFPQRRESYLFLPSHHMVTYGDSKRGEVEHI